MTKQDYINSQLSLGKTHSKIIAEQPMVDVVGSIRGDNLRSAYLSTDSTYTARLSESSTINAIISASSTFNARLN